MLIGTAGHIDHGKTALIKRLTGRNTDRLPEEIKRGISIELGYAYETLDDGSIIGFIDVPGHERFVHTMVAGATGMDFALLVVAADDGVMPQTDEHLDILAMLGIGRGAVALTKIDMVDAARIDEVIAQLAARTSGLAAGAWPVFPVSSLSGAGIEALRDELHAQARALHRREAAGHFRLAIDRVFTLAGIGTVVTGTAHAGRVQVGDTVAIEPRGTTARVRSLHVQDKAAQSGACGDRCALNLAGIEKADVDRGLWIQSTALDNATDRLDVALSLAPNPGRALPSGSSLHFHHATSDVIARVARLDGDEFEAGATALASVVLDRPIGACRGDRFIVRDAQARRTLGGGVVLDIAPPRRGRRTDARLAVLRALRDQAPAQAVAAWLEHEIVALARLQSGWNLLGGETTALLQSCNARVAAGFAFSAARWRLLHDKLRAAVAATHEREPEMPGVEQHRLRRMVAPALSADAFAELIEEQLGAGRLVRRGAFVGDPSHKAELGSAERLRWEKIKPLLMEQRFEPPRVRDIARTTKIPEAEVRTVLRRVARVGEITLVAHDHFFLTDAVRAMADITAELAGAAGAARAAQFRDRIGGGRKVAIQILEFFDRVGYTRRVRDDHLVRRPNPWTT